MSRMSTLISVNDFIEETNFYAFRICLDKPGMLVDDDVIKELGISRQDYIDICKKYKTTVEIIKWAAYNKEILKVLFYHEEEAKKAIDDLIAFSLMNKLNS